MYAAAAIGALILLLSAVAVLFRGKWLIHRTVLFCGLSFGLLSMLINPYGSVPDESAHLSAAYLKYCSLRGDCVEKQEAAAEGIHDKVYPQYRANVRKEDAALIDKAQSYPSATDYHQLLSDWQWQAERVDRTKEEVLLLDTNSTLISYLPAVIGIALANALNLSFFPMVYLSRLMMLLFYEACACIAVRRTPIGKTTIAIVAILPMATYLAASLSYDAVLIGLSLLVTAQWLFLSYGDMHKHGVRWRDVAVCAVLMGLLAQGKGVSYVGLFFLAFLIPRDRFKNGAQRAAMLSTVLLATLAAVAYSNLDTFPAFLDAGERTFDSTRGLPWIFNSPVEFLAACFTTVRCSILKWTWGLVGAFLGTGGIRVSKLICSLIFCLFLTSALFSERADGKALNPVPASRLFAAVPAFLSLFIYLFSMALWETHEGDQMIGGIQGRYFLEIVAPLFLTIRINHSSARWISDLTFCLSIAFSGMILYENFLIILMR